MDSYLLGLRLGNPTSETKILRLAFHMQAGDNLFRRLKSVRALSGQSYGFRLERATMEFVSTSMTLAVFNADVC